MPCRIPSPPENQDVKVSIPVVVGLLHVEPPDKPFEPRLFRPIDKRTITGILEVANLILKAPRRRHDVEMPISAKIIDNSPPRQSHHVHPQIPRYIRKTGEVVRILQEAHGNPPLRRHLFGIRSNGHRGYIEEPLRIQIVGVFPQNFFVKRHGLLCRLLILVNALFFKRQKAPLRVRILHAISHFASPEVADGEPRLHGRPEGHRGPPFLRKIEEFGIMLNGPLVFPRPEKFVRKSPLVIHPLSEIGRRLHSLYPRRTSFIHVKTPTWIVLGLLGNAVESLRHFYRARGPCGLTFFVSTPP
jgi:hypothetical protein